ncbi:MAG: hypothetical protein EAZ65_01280 [Verrucomicrobia bacterium]|nr:MAG: hypothetical protein EAZ84_06195 [Verrucomicrobiota bacterium]TAE89161.1 MAG: hypothetical protein EAZ82_00620 [Verrucomicrobiota bacterium]TAF27964.1 MAG: hypothetical protein EAZ71_01285 [Verrucomicrobiota bacterium]TAF42812.1 MAG: hypothetical protein EAZ65_01280 [Verrucomicrobiota bacterium]
MKALRVISLSLMLPVIVHAGAPQKKNVASYSQLWLNSPFTSKPPAPERGPELSAFEDWALGGVSEIEGGYMVTLLHKKNVGETQIIRPSGTISTGKDGMKYLKPGDPGSFKVERVDFGSSDWKTTKVQLSSDGRVGAVEFDDKLIAPAASAAPVGNRPPGQPGQPGVPAIQNPPGLIQPQPPGLRPPRQRVLPPNPVQGQGQGQIPRR